MFEQHLCSLVSDMQEYQDWWRYDALYVKSIDSNGVAECMRRIVTNRQALVPQYNVLFDLVRMLRKAEQCFEEYPFLIAEQLHSHNKFMLVPK